MDADLHHTPAAHALSAGVETNDLTTDGVLRPAACDTHDQSPPMVNRSAEPGPSVGPRILAAQMGCAESTTACCLVLDQSGAIDQHATTSLDPSSPPHPVQQFLLDMTSPVSGPLLAGPRSPPPLTKQRRARRPPATATRRSYRLQGRKEALSGGGNTSLRLARRVLVGKRGLTIAEPGEEEEEETLERYKLTFKKPLTDRQIDALSALAKSASVRNARKGRRT